jgi:tRNA (cmo5U34)-methyltransferase
MREICYKAGSKFVTDGAWIVDLGASRGGALAPFVEQHGARVKFCAVEISPPMANALRERFAGYIDANVMQVREEDLRDFYPQVRSCLTIANLTLQFVPINHRHRIVRDAWENLDPGGAFILTEKVLGGDWASERLMVDLYHDLKLKNGYSQDDVEVKRKSLEGVLVPMTAAWNEEMLRHAGFTTVECIWRHYQFAMWIAIK